MYNPQNTSSLRSTNPQNKISHDARTYKTQIRYDVRTHKAKIRYDTTNPQNTNQSQYNEHITHQSKMNKGKVKE